MNKLIKILIATLGGIDTVFTIGIPIFISIFWIRFSGILNWSSYVLLSAGILSTIFRAIKIGVLK